MIPRYRFERLVADALDDLPDELAAVLDNVVVVVEDRHPDEPDLLGLYEGVPHTERIRATRGRTSSASTGSRCARCATTRTTSPRRST